MNVIYNGPYSNVYREDKYAVKKVDRDFSLPPHNIDRELQLVKSLDHPNVIKFLKVENKLDDVMMYMEFYPQNLQEYLKANCRKKSRFVVGQVSFVTESRLSLDSIAHVLDQVIEAIWFVHKNGIIHRDIKPSNFLVTQEPELRVVLCDFSISVAVGENDQISDVCSTYYKPLEVIFGLEYGLEIDVWGLGIMISHLYSRSCTNTLFEEEDINDGYRAISDFKIIDRIFKRFGTPTKDDENSINYWPEIFEVENFQLIQLNSRPRQLDIFPRGTDEKMVTLFNRICDMNQKRRIAMSEVRDRWTQIREGSS
ncbi:mitogen-activated protein kinase [Yamadazyma tenuis]|uniref:Kinase-like protein n=1 Tax=Candida tenuis (strain ATCC 10573 / BCRC 21748 / CBS 615 / JCM 9827 / NBRC 10315 / NRRL Y-1498 / VKM Y-70) TaxID=590646 RepID=G3B7T7_CANTC|nr:kinase-like protein [Yamadazyma tenuis ATCC 10573]XP_006689024.1 uncharacterized protein CANTEDRAFT_115780 [Yamadazyma tenuis ATCC 10573]EGV62853.1 kinase-like protein [Yamadazyma tenuis ATCC 10573]EGV62854.1 hypothetical protein CANTEDRAFT_115780 [Yamadazyma tenuis ATCC 10573]WEJ93577.1 mitogen-activated protein kinase [Yamadazyma tenuis]